MMRDKVTRQSMVRFRFGSPFSSASLCRPVVVSLIEPRPFLLTSLALPLGQTGSQGQRQYTSAVVFLVVSLRREADLGYYVSMDTVMLTSPFFTSTISRQRLLLFLCVFFFFFVLLFYGLNLVQNGFFPSPMLVVSP